jgi:hypothetical protein
MNIALWIVQALLAAMYAMAGTMKTTQPKEKLADRMSWVNDYSGGTVKFVGAMEFLGALGLILPWATGIATILTPLAAVGLAVIQALAIAYHVRKREFSVLPVNVILLALAVFVAIGRF